MLCGNVIIVQWMEGVLIAEKQVSKIANCSMSLKTRELSIGQTIVGTQEGMNKNLLKCNTILVSPII